MAGVPLRTLRDVWYHNLEKFPSKTAVICEGRSYSYAECDLLTDRLRRGLAERFGFGPGDRVAIAGPNSLEYVLAYWAVQKSGGAVVPVNVRLGAEELGHLIRESDAEILLIDARSRALVERALNGGARPKHTVGIGYEGAGVTLFHALVAEGDAYGLYPEIGDEDTGIIMFTSGTTGRPKGAVMRQVDLMFNNKLAIYAHGLRHEDVHLLVVPMFHATALYSLVPTAALTGATLVVAPRPDPGEAAALIEAHQVTTFFGVPTLFRFLTVMKGVEKYDLSSLRLMAYAGATMPAATIRRLRELFPHSALHNFFGLTETISMTHVLPDRDAGVRPESVGKLLPHVRQRIVKPDGTDAAPGEVGELCFHRSNVISRYWKRPGLLEESLEGEWFRTGDLAAMDEEGYVYLKGRSKELIIVGGENVYAEEVEQCLLAHEKVAEAAVVGVPATGVRVHLGEVVRAVIVPRQGMDLSVPEIKRHCMKRLASYKVPQVVEFRNELPRNAAGKVMKRLLE